MVTIKDIAARLNVSASTVGRALADDPRISSGMKQKVQEVADEIGYVANRAARMMRGVSSNLVGLIVPDIRNGFYSTIAHALSKCLEQDGFQLTLSETDDDRAVELRHVRELVSANVVGMILVPSAKPLPETVRLLKTMPHIQLLRQHAALGEQWFGIDDHKALALAVGHLLAAGHRRIAYVGPSTDLPTGAARLQGYRDALAPTNAWDAELEVCGSPSATDFGREALRRLLALEKPPTGLVLGAVQHTYSVLDECLSRGMRVPEELSVVGFGDEPGFRWWGSGLTTIGLPVSELATACGLWFLHQLRQRPPVMPDYRSMSTPTLVIRGSTRTLVPMPATSAQKPARAKSRSA
ncbi:LacI family DNA-binding transcriptional regulator [Aquabacterium sp.]|uniref:LacI family DNA-binding transcriptional regulator n=1 Tax=Aquabacterium sp. TaxID=1872578 RepID=UPI002CBB6DC3|nr:LacI family DNA-binding transcriptional regulator [Aquabacterium sp.]HSW04482.1 LacI family DNA-binding transcriptional regulator [Aquabacterium sp.]